MADDEARNRGVVVVGWRHGPVFALTTTRLGGVSEGPYRSLNLSERVGDDDLAVHANITCLASALGVSETNIARVRQVHGVEVVPTARGGDCSVEADGLVAAADGPVLALSIADCLAVLVHDTRTGARGAAHAGWRGTVGQVTQRLLDTMGDIYGTHPSDCTAFLSPCVGPCCYRVPHGAEHPLTREPDVEPLLLRPTSDGHALDLVAGNTAQLLDAGLRADRVLADRRCTACHPELFFSYVRDRGVTGRMWALIGTNEGPCKVSLQ